MLTRANRAPAILILALSAAPILPACSAPTEPLRLESKLDGNLGAAIKLEGPIQIQMQGPTIRYEGTYISDDLFGEIEVSKATSDWLIAVLGEPTARTPLKDGSEIWRWTYRPVEQQSSMVELFSKSEKEPKLATRTVFIQIRNDTVTRKWKG